MLHMHRETFVSYTSPYDGLSMRVKLKLVTASVWLGVMWCDKVRTMLSMLYLDVHEADEAPICSCGSYSRRA